VVLNCFELQNSDAEHRNSTIIFFFHLRQTDFKSFALRAAFVSQKNRADKKPTALELCKQEQDVEASEVSCRCAPIFHTLINNCVENLITQKYFSRSSAQLLPTASSHFLTGAERGC
jgi:hypothetical protein